MKTVKILGIPFTFFEDIKDFENKVISFLKEEKVHSIFTPNAEMISISERDDIFKDMLINSDLNIPDGIGIILLAKKFGYKNLRKLAGIDAMKYILHLSIRENIPVYFLGAKKEVLEELIDRIKKDYKGISIAGYHHGYFLKDSQEKIIEDINKSGAKILFVALGAPKQEIWISKNKNKLKVRIAMGVGGSFDVLSGKKRRAPKIFIDLGLEWLYRILQDPIRLIRRAPNLFYFLYLYIIRS
ncbi:MAG: WecB/TagA/CpsF family glycosyltransferase [Dictyoglomus sp.]|nr:WecB/TagA/CpsF family glycosyltransferase [Dictyoglomus sp.]MCX7941739.1 WecB/TagA/CpsF family glycosyltransferase [Dictyoglomaceae bacterium]MDW8189032.1 WecB/TagA/CpsF family glycosyltransferase [Dictyoglomus sp.]